MPDWLVKILGAIYTKVPKQYRPPIKKIFYWILIRIQSLFSFRKVYKGMGIEFLDFEIANLEPFEYLGPSSNEVMIEAYKSVVSPGTEQAVLCGMPGARKMFPYAPGYSLAGKVIKKGKNVKSLEIGDRIVGQINHKSHEVLNPDKLFKIPDDVSFEEASFMELAIITLQGIRKADIKPGDRVAVVGQGLIGQFANKIVKLVGASEIIAIANSRSREKTAITSGGVDKYIALSENEEIANEIQADVVIEAVGSPKGIIAALKCCRDGGKVILLGSSRGLGRSVDWWEIVQKRDIIVIGAHISAIPDKDASFNRWTYEQEGELFLELLKSQRIKVSDMVTWDAKPEESNAVYEALAEGGKGHVGIMFEWKQ